MEREFTGFRIRSKALSGLAGINILEIKNGGNGSLKAKRYPQKEGVGAGAAHAGRGGGRVH
jgi:hypothetical protein